MYLWNVDALVSDFKKNNVSQKEELKYLACLSVLTLLAMDPIFYVGYAYTILEPVNSALNIGICLVGLYRCYRNNAAGDDCQFISRVVCLGLPVMVRVLAIFVPLSIVVAVGESLWFDGSRFDDSGKIAIGIPQIVVGALIMLAYYWYLSLKIRAVSTSRV